MENSTSAPSSGSVEHSDLASSTIAPAPSGNTMLQLASTVLASSATPGLRPGPKSKPVALRSMTSFAPPRRRLQQSHTREFKIGVLAWWTHAQVPPPNSPSGKLCSPTVKDVSLRYQVPISTLPDWRRNESHILMPKKILRVPVPRKAEHYGWKWKCFSIKHIGAEERKKRLFRKDGFEGSL